MWSKSRIPDLVLPLGGRGIQKSLRLFEPQFLYSGEDDPLGVCAGIQMGLGFCEHVANRAVLLGWGELGVKRHTFYPKHLLWRETRLHTPGLELWAGPEGTTWSHVPRVLGRGC